VNYFSERCSSRLAIEVEATGHALDDTMPALGPSRLFTVTLRATRRLSELLKHLCVLIPVLDDQKHYFVGDEEVERLPRRGEGCSRATQRGRSSLRDTWCISAVWFATHREADSRGATRRGDCRGKERRTGGVNRADDQPLPDR
jgi:RNA repair, ligase-Pnkp-associating, region of Hen1